MKYRKESSANHLSSRRPATGYAMQEFLQDDELVVRFFGMKETDGTFRVAADLSRGE